MCCAPAPVFTVQMQLCRWEGTFMTGSQDQTKQMFAVSALQAAVACLLAMCP